MSGENLREREFKNKTVKELAGMGGKNTPYHFKIECSSMTDVSIGKIKEWLKNDESETLAEDVHRTGSNGGKVWQEAFQSISNYTKHSETDFKIFYDSGNRGPSERTVRVGIHEATVEIKNTTVNDVFYITLSRSGGTPDKVMIMKA